MANALSFYKLAQFSSCLLFMEKTFIMWMLLKCEPKLYCIIRFAKPLLITIFAFITHCAFLCSFPFFFLFPFLN